MATLNIAIHKNPHREMSNAPMLSGVTHQQDVAFDAASAAITGPCEVILTVDAKARLDCRSVSGDLDPDASAVVLQADQPTAYQLEGGTWYLEATAYA